MIGPIQCDIHLDEQNLRGVGRLRSGGNVGHEPGECVPWFMATSLVRLGEQHANS